MRHVLKAQEPETLIALIKREQGLSQRHTKRVLDQKCVWVNGKLVWIAKHPLKRGDTITVHTDPLHADPRNPPILFEDDQLVIFNKRPYITVTGGYSLEGFLRDQRREKPLRAVHRLDRETTGCVVFSRNPETQQRLLSLFKERAIEKDYHTVVHGKVPWKNKLFDHRLDQKSARTHCTCVATSKHRSLLHVRLETGRKHQVRRHLAEAGFPVVGDKQYGVTDGAVPRQLLHAARIRFQHPGTQQGLDITAPPPADFSDALSAFPGYSEPGSKRG